ncbi:MAG TPA: hypothetical protein VK539_08735 [Myxococcaceae bacterium]|nr:hypothetical protein [Myxococcaceae bacterium]
MRLGSREFGKKVGGQLGLDLTPTAVDALLATLKEGSGGFLDSPW